MLLLLSGGMDSALCLHRHGADLTVSFDYGQTHLVELEYAERLAAHYQVPYERIMLPRLPLVDDVVFAGRNAVFLAHAAAIAKARKLHTVVIGCNATDAERFPDCTTAFLRAMNTAFLNAYGVGIDAPLLGMTKAEVAAAAAAEGLPQTWSCYGPGPEPCSECLACKLRNGQ